MALGVQNFEKINLLGVNVSNLRKEQLNEAIKEIIEADEKKTILNVNIHGMNIAYQNEWYRNLLNSAFINFCDGDGVRLGAKILGRTIHEKITYNRWIWDLAAFSERHDFSWYMLGSKPGIVDKCREILISKYPKLNICGYHHGYLDKSGVNQAVVSELKEKSPNILILGMGMPLQEEWLIKNIHEINYNVVLTGGAVFDYTSGEAKMTPKIFYDLKLEWFYRFWHEPKRLFRRYFVGNPLFMYRVLREKILRRS